MVALRIKRRGSEAASSFRAGVKHPAKERHTALSYAAIGAKEKNTWVLWDGIFHIVQSGHVAVTAALFASLFRHSPVGDRRCGQTTFSHSGSDGLQIAQAFYIISLIQQVIRSLAAQLWQSQEEYCGTRTGNY